VKYDTEQTKCYQNIRQQITFYLIGGNYYQQNLTITQKFWKIAARISDNSLIKKKGVK